MFAIGATRLTQGTFGGGRSALPEPGRLADAAGAEQEVAGAWILEESSYRFQICFLLGIYLARL
jgi:hypothetical protein